MYPYPFSPYFSSNAGYPYGNLFPYGGMGGGWGNWGVMPYSTGYEEGGGTATGWWGYDMRGGRPTRGGYGAWSHGGCDVYGGFRAWDWPYGGFGCEGCGW